jgi:hypothetical protein
MNKYLNYKYLRRQNTGVKAKQIKSYHQLATATMLILRPTSEQRLSFPNITKMEVANFFLLSKGCVRRCYQDLR